MATNHPAASRLRPGAVLAVLATLALGCAEAPTSPRSSDVGTLSFGVNCNEKPDHPKCGGGGDGGESTTATVEITTSIAGAGIYSNPASAEYPGEFNGDGDLWVSAPCDAGLAFELELPDQGLSGSDCNDGSTAPRLTMAGLLGVTSETPVALASTYQDESTNFGSAHNYYFEVAGVRHNLVWRPQLYAHVADNGDGTKTYTVTTEPDQADAELWKTFSGNGKPRMELVGPATAHLELKVTVSN